MDACIAIDCSRGIKYADDSACAGPLENVKEWFEMLSEKGLMLPSRAIKICPGGGSKI